MPPTRTASSDERRGAAQRARRERADRITRLRRRVLATAVGTFAVAFAVIAFDGSTGSATGSSAVTPASRSAAPPSAAQPTQADQPASGDASGATSSDPLTTSQS